MLCALILYISGGTNSLKSTPNDRCFEKLSIAILFLRPEFFATNLLRGNRRRNTFRISFWCLAWGSNPGFKSNKPTRYLLNHSDLNCPIVFILQRIKEFLSFPMKQKEERNQTNLVIFTNFERTIKKKRLLNETLWSVITPFFPRISTEYRMQLSDG